MEQIPSNTMLASLSMNSLRPSTLPSSSSAWQSCCSSPSDLFSQTGQGSQPQTSRCEAWPQNTLLSYSPTMRNRRQGHCAGVAHNLTLFSSMWASLPGGSAP